jgi:hypothetical protein
VREGADVVTARPASRGRASDVVTADRGGRSGARYGRPRSRRRTVAADRGRGSPARHGRPRSRRRTVGLIVTALAVAAATLLSGCSALGSLVGTEDALQNAGYQSVHVSPHASHGGDYVSVSVRVQAAPTAEDASNVAHVVWQKFRERFDHINVTVHGTGPDVHQTFTHAELESMFGARNPSYDKTSISRADTELGVEVIGGVVLILVAIGVTAVLVHRRRSRRRQAGQDATAGIGWYAGGTRWYPGTGDPRSQGWPPGPYDDGRGTGSAVGGPGAGGPAGTGGDTGWPSWYPTGQPGGPGETGGAAGAGDPAAGGPPAGEPGWPSWYTGRPAGPGGAGGPGASAPGGTPAAGGDAIGVPAAGAAHPSQDPAVVGSALPPPSGPLWAPPDHPPFPVAPPTGAQPGTAIDAVSEPASTANGPVQRRQLENPANTPPGDTRPDWGPPPDRDDVGPAPG